MRSAASPGLLLASLLMAGCGLALDIGAPSVVAPDGGRPRRDAGAGDARAAGDADQPPDASSDADVTPDATAPDATAPDATTPDPRCAPAPDADTVALYTFDMDPPGELDDAVSDHSGNEIGALAHAPGPTRLGCGQGIGFPGPTGVAGHGEIPDHVDWQLPEGSIDLWVKASMHGTQGVISRDARGAEESGHIGLSIAETGHLVLRIQSIAVPNAVWRCSASPVALDTWVYIGINFGPPGAELWVDGVLGSDSAIVTMLNRDGAEFDVPCANDQPLGIDGNFESWILGIKSTWREPRTEGPLYFPFHQGRLDHLRISRVRRVYGPGG